MALEPDPDSDVDLDRTDMAILHVLQDDARNITTEAIGDRVGLAASTVANRIADLEESGVIEGYMPIIDHETAGFEHRMLLVGTIEDADREDVVDQVSAIENVVSVTVLMVDEDNVHVELVSQSQDRTERVADELNDIGIEISKTGVITAQRDRPFNHFGRKYTTDS
ncbi:Lrp/AsnC family transcriptional regulator [Halopiger aswanensis]|nr:winged helix-turn-helix transcriptional regulator [Halopiger aswanensis]